MTDILPRRHYLWSGFDLPFFIEARIDDPRITLRTWRLSADAPLDNVMPQAEAAGLLAGHAPPFEIESDPLGLSRSGRDLWVPLEALGGTQIPGARRRNLFVRPVSQVGFVIDPGIMGPGAWSDYAMWLFNARRDGQLELPFNRHVETYGSKAHRHVLTLSRHEVNLLTLAVPFAGEDFSHCSFILKYNRELGCAHNMPQAYAMPATRVGWASYDMQALFGVKALLPELRLSGPDVIAAGQTARFAVSIHDRNTESPILDKPVRVYLEASAGYLAQRQAATAGGAASVALTALGLEPGETIKLKAGWRQFSGAAEKLVTIV